MSNRRGGLVGLEPVATTQKQKEACNHLTWGSQRKHNHSASIFFRQRSENTDHPALTQHNEHRGVRSPAHRQADRQTDRFWARGVGCTLTLQLAGSWGEAFSFQTHSQTGRGPASHCAEKCISGSNQSRWEPEPGRFYLREHISISV